MSDKITYKPYSQSEQWLLPPSLENVQGRLDCKFKLLVEHEAPLQAGDIVGKITYSVGEVALEEVPLVAVTAVDAGSGFKRLVDKLAARFF